MTRRQRTMFERHQAVNRRFAFDRRMRHKPAPPQDFMGPLRRVYAGVVVNGDLA